MDYEDAYDEHRGTAAKRGYSYRWQQYRAWFLARWPHCGDRPTGAPDTPDSECRAAGKETKATLVDHIVPVTGPQDPSFFVPKCQQALCEHCHNVKRQRESEEAKAAMGVNNSDTPAKIEIRQRVLEALTPEKTVVFDAFAGTGEMYRAVWHRAADYVGCDEKWGGPDNPRRCFVADNRRVLRCLDLAPFTCFDLDAYADGWAQAIIIAARRPPLRPGERVGFVLTDGGWIAFAMAGRMSGPMRQAAGLSEQRLNLASLGVTDRQTTPAARKLTRERRVKRFDDLISTACHRVAANMRGRVSREWRATGVMNPITKGAYMRYRGIIIEGLAP